MSNVERFEFAFAPSYARASRPFRITPKSAWVSIDDVLFDARFGHWRVSTPLANITEVEVTGPYHFYKTAGPARLAVTDRGLTFATNGDRGVRIGFRTPVPGLDRLGVLRHPELTVTVADIDRLVKVLRARARALH
ncbi:MAG TPA: hypothetical protein VGN29_12285 [Solirubrobacteraceae bacterium]|nr:hypothetical protein [Solirubrobacteraceae bacterium]